MAVAERPAQGYPTSEGLRHLLIAVHRNDVWPPDQERCRGTVHRHGELVAVDHIHPQFAKHPREIADTAPVDWPTQREGVRFESDLPELLAQPANALGGPNRYHGVSAPAQLLGERRVPIQRARLVGFNHLGDGERSRHMKCSS